MSTIPASRRAFAQSSTAATSTDRKPGRLLVRLAFVPAFLSGLDLIVGTGPVQLTHLMLAGVFGLLLVANRGSLPGGFVTLFYALLGASCFSVVWTAATFGAVEERLLSTISKVTLAVVILATYYAAYVLVGRDVRAFFYEYLRVAVFFAALGLLQEAVFIATGTNIFGFLLTGAKVYDSFLGISALSVEPAFYACALLPAAAYYVSLFASELKISWRAVVVVGALLLSTSAVGYLGLVAAAGITILAGIRPSRAWMVVISLPVAVLAANWMLQLEFIQLRLNDSLRLLDTGVGAGDGTNLSSYALAVNADIASRSVVDNYGMGAGFGLYGTVFDHYIGDYSIPMYRSTLPGRGSATSFLLRIVGELGIIGLAVIAWLLRSMVVAVRRGINRPIAIACLASFAAILLRMGEYFDNGVMFALLLAFLLQRETCDTAGRTKEREVRCRSRSLGETSAR